MADSTVSTIASILRDNLSAITTAWMTQLSSSGVLETGRIKEAELHTEATKFLRQLSADTASGSDDTRSAAYEETRAILGQMSRSRAMQGFTPTETATFVFSLKQAMFGLPQIKENKDVTALVWTINLILDSLGLFTMEVYQKSRDEIIVRQQEEIAELSTPVVKLWDGILALPLIGTLDSARTQVVMENLLQSIVSHGAEIAIIDITGVPTVDTLVAQHLLRTVAAARLMGADCIISGIRPQIAQTMVHLGVDLNVVSKSSLADAFSLALRQTGRTVVQLAKQTSETSN